MGNKYSTLKKGKYYLRVRDAPFSNIFEMHAIIQVIKEYGKIKEYGNHIKVIVLTGKNAGYSYITCVNKDDWLELNNIKLLEVLYG